GEVPKSTGDAERGKKLMQTSGCLNCHALEQPNSFKTHALAETLKADWTKGCKLADFGLTDDQRLALAAFAKTDLSSLKRESPVEFAEREIKTLRCTACHARDSQPDLWSSVSSEAPQVETPPAEGEQISVDQT